MPIPLVWLGASIVAVAAGQQLLRYNDKLNRHIKSFPGETTTSVVPQNGAVVCCGIYGVFEHTGIWVDGNIIELRGNGLIRGISPERFLADRTGNTIFVLGGPSMTPLISALSGERALSKLYTYCDYDVIENNCHRFVWQCVSGEDAPITRFQSLNMTMAEYFQTELHWYVADI